MIAGRISE
jgi:AFG3 family protein